MEDFWFNVDELKGNMSEENDLSHGPILVDDQLEEHNPNQSAVSVNPDNSAVTLSQGYPQFFL